MKYVLNATASELVDEKNINPVTKNLPDDEIISNKELISSQKNCVITINLISIKVSVVELGQFFG